MIDVSGPENEQHGSHGDWNGLHDRSRTFRSKTGAVVAKRPGRESRQAGGLTPARPGRSADNIDRCLMLTLEQYLQHRASPAQRMGMGEVPARLEADLLRIGAVDNGAGRLLFPSALVEDAIDKAAKRFVLHGRDEDRSIEVGGDRVYFGTGGAAVQTLDLDSGFTVPQRWPICTISPGCRTRWPMSAGTPAAVWQPTCPIISTSTPTRPMPC